MKTWLVMGLMLGLAGCANQTSIWRNESGAGNVMAMDAQQRVVLSSSRAVPTVLGTETIVQGTGAQRVTTTRPIIRDVPKVYYCPEPSPDAIASFASALGLGLSKTTGTESTEGKLNSALATSIASVGLRTPTTQVIRDLITAACIAEMNGSFENAEFRDAFARNQQFVLAAHAIAVIGGEAVAGHAGVSGTSGTSGPDPVEAYNNLKAAQAARQTAEVSLKDAETAKQTAIDATNKADAELQAEPDNKDKQDALAKAKSDQSEAESAADDAASRLKTAKDLEASAAKVASAATAFTAAAASGTVSPGTNFMPSKEKLGDTAVKQIGAITTQVLAQGFTLDKCIAHLKDIQAMSKYAKSGELDQLRADVMDLCSEQVKAQRDIQRSTRQFLLR